MYAIDEFDWFRHGVIGAIGSLVFLYPLYKIVWSMQNGIYGVLPFVYIGWTVLGVGFLAYTRVTRPDVVDAVGTSLTEPEPAAAAAAGRPHRSPGAHT